MSMEDNSNQPVQRGPNYNWEHEAKHYQDECDQLRDLLQKVERSGDVLFEENYKLKSALEFLIDHNPHDGEQGACFYCDMGGSGYSTKGDGNHDDVRYVCPVVVALKALNRR